MKIKKDEFVMSYQYKKIYSQNGYIYYQERNNLKSFFKSFKKYPVAYLLTLGNLILSLCLVVLNNIRVKEIIINGDYPINQSLKKYIFKNCNNFFGIKILDKELDDLNYMVRQEYNMYEWISIKKTGNILYADITKRPEYEKINYKEEKRDLISKYDGIIKFFRIYQGLNQVYYNKSVKKGDVLISMDVYGKQVSPRGLIIASVFETMDIKILKTEIYKAFSGRVEETNLFQFGNLKFRFGKNKFHDYMIKKTERFSLFNFIKYYNIEYYEKSDIISIYDKEEAYELAVEKINRTFVENMVDEKEKIEEIILLETIEREKDFYFRFLIKSQKNIT